MQIANSAPLERLTFDSAEHPPAERFERYREFNAGGADAIESGPAFRAMVDRWRLDRAVVHDRRLNDVTHVRDADRAGADRFDHFMLHLVRSGRYEVDIGAGFTTLSPGEIVLVDMLAPMRTRAAGAHVITTSLARDLLIASLGRRDLHGLVIGARDAVLIGDFLGSFLTRIQTLPPGAAVTVVQALVALVTFAVEDGGGADESAGDDRYDQMAEAARLDALRRLIERNLGDPGFTAERVGEIARISRTGLYRLFKSHGGVSAYIHKRRLDRARVALTDRGDPRTLGEVAAGAGFASESHFSRAFRQAFGLRPGQYRAAVAQPGEGAVRDLPLWFDELK